MAMQQCPNGHLYDDETNVGGCPFCNGASTVAATQPLSTPAAPGAGMGAGGAFPTTVPLDGVNFTPPTPGVRDDGAFPTTTPVEDNSLVTTFVTDTVNSNGILEVRGWLVCVEGKKRGMDYRIYGERNTIGRGDQNDIRLEFDSSISKDSNAIISYDRKNNKFYLSPCDAKNNIYLNDKILLTPEEIFDYDVMEIGETKMMFRSLCNEKFNWTVDKKDEE